MQQYAEVLVRAQPKRAKAVKTAVFLLGALMMMAIVAMTIYVMGFFSVMMRWSVLPFTILLCLLTTWGILTALEQLRIEYEYAISDASITVDRIRAKKRRKQILHLSLSCVTAFGRQTERLPLAQKILDVTGTPEDEGVWYLDYRTERESVRLFFCPDAAGLEILKRALRRVMSREDLC